MAAKALHSVLHYVRRTAESADTRALTDQQLLERYRTRKDDAAFAALVRRHGRTVHSACRQVLADEADVEDAFQATFLVLVRKAGAVRWQSAIGNWLYSVAHRIAVRARANAHRRKDRESRAGKQERGADLPDLSWREAVGVLHEELDRLPDKFRLPLLACYLNGQSRDEAAAQLGWSASTLKGRLETGRKRLRTRLVRRGIELSAGLLAILAAEPGQATPLLLVRAAVRLGAGGAPSVAVASLARGLPVALTAGSTKLTAGLLLVVGVLSGGAGVSLLVPAGVPVAAGSPTLLDEHGEQKATPETPNAQAVPDAADAGMVRGQVLDPNGRPVAGATIYRLDPEYRSRAAIETKVTTTGPDGRFQATAGGPCIFAASANGSAPDWTLPARPGDDVTLTLADDFPIRGRLVDLEGRPVRGAKVRVLAVRAPADGDLKGAYNAFRLNPEWTGSALPKYLGGGSAGLPTEAKTGEDGRFELKGLGRGRVAELRFEADGMEAAKVHVFSDPDFDPKSVTPTEAEKAMSSFLPGYRPAVYGPNFTHAAHPSHIITGVVTDSATGKPVAGVTIVGSAGPTYSTDEPDWSNALEVTTDPAGRFGLSGLPKARRRFLHAQAGDNPYLDQLVQVDDTQGLAPVSVEIKLHRCVVVEGRIVDKATGRAVKGQVLYLPMADNQELKARPDTRLYRGGLHTGFPTGTLAFTDADGKFRLRVLHGPGVILARADTMRAPAARYTPARAAEADRKYLWRLAPDAIEVGPKFRADDESFNTAGTTVPLRWENGYALLNPGAQDNAATCEIRFDPGRTVAGTVVGPDGGPVTGAKAIGLQGTDEHWPTTLHTAKFTAYALDPARPRELYVLHEGRKLAGTLTLRGDEQAPPVVTLKPCAGVTGQVLNADGTPAAGVQISFQMADKEPDEFIRQKLCSERPLAVTDKDGRFRAEGLFSGFGMTIFTFKPGYRSGISFPQLAPLTPGEFKDLGDVRFPDPKAGGGSP